MKKRAEELTVAFVSWLERYSPRRHLSDKPDAQQREIDALMALVLRNAPPQGYLQWFKDLIEILDLSLRTPTWPLVSEIADACSKLKTSNYFEQSGQVRLNRFELTAKRMRAGEAVGEEYLFGSSAFELLGRGYVRSELLTSYRESFFRQLADQYGTARAETKKAELLAKEC